MKDAEIESLYAVIGAVRLLFHRLGADATRLHGASGVSAGMRGVMEMLADAGAQTVPAMARRRGVSRQHIQTLANDLLAAGLVATRANPSHKRSLFVDLTEDGRDRFAAMRARETEALRRFKADIDPADLKTTTAVLSALLSGFEGAEWRRVIDGLSEAAPEVRKSGT